MEDVELVQKNEDTRDLEQAQSELVDLIKSRFVSKHKVSFISALTRVIQLSSGKEQPGLSDVDLAQCLYILHDHFTFDEILSAMKIKNKDGYGLLFFARKNAKKGLHRLDLVEAYSDSLNVINEKGLSRLRVALMKNDVVEFRAVLKEGMDPFDGHCYEPGTVCYAAMHDYAGIIDCLVNEFGVDITFEDKKKRDPELLRRSGASDGEDYYYYSETSENLHAIKSLVKYGANVNVTQYGETALHLAVRARRYLTVECLLSFGADIHHAGREETPLGLAIAFCSAEMVCLLMEHGSAVTYNESGRRLLFNSRTGRVLKGKNTPEMREAYVQAAANGDLKTVKNLLEKGVNPRAKNAQGETAFLVAVKYGHFEVVEALIKDDVLILQDEKDLALFFATMDLLSGVKLVNVLLGIGANVNSSLMPLRSAVVNGHFLVVKRLLKNGAKIEESVLTCALELGRFDIAFLLARKGAVVSEENKQAFRSPEGIAAIRKELKYAVEKDSFKKFNKRFLDFVPSELLIELEAELKTKIKATRVFDGEYKKMSALIASRATQSSGSVLMPAAAQDNNVDKSLEKSHVRTL